ncbi:GAF domain-containing protein [Deinococcus sp. UYEF24]
MTSPPGAESEPFAPLAAYIQEITEALAATTTEREVIEIVLTPAVQAIGASAGIVLSVDQTDQQMKIAGSQGYEDGLPTLWQEGPINNNVLIADILRMKEALYFEDAGALKKAYPELERRTGGLLPVANATLPMFLDGQPLGVIVLDFQEPHHFSSAERRFLKILSAQCAIALGRTQATVLLQSRVEEQTRHLRERTQQLEDERAAQAAFVTFTEAVGSETDLPTLIRQAITVLQGRFPGASVVYYEEEGKLWMGRLWSDDMGPELIEVITSGLRVETPLIAKVLHTRAPVFTDAWDAQRESVASSEEYGAAANYPLLIGGELRQLLSIGLRDVRTWSEADKALLRAVGRGLSLALERTEAARQLTRQNAELQARTRALEGFALLTRDFSLEHDPVNLVGRAQALILSLLPTGVSTYYELQDDQWHLASHRGAFQDLRLLQILQGGVPRGSVLNLDRPLDTRLPHYQEPFDVSTTTVAQEEFRIIRATAALPIFVADHVQGVLVFGLYQEHIWSIPERTVLETVTHSLGLALERSRAIRELVEQRDLLNLKTASLSAANEELEAFTYSASHDLRTPVRHVMGFTELAQKAMAAAHIEKADQYLEVVKQGALRMTAMIDGMLLLSRSGQEALHPQPVDLNALVVQARRDAGAEFAAHPVRWHIDTLPQVWGDRAMLQQVMTNLLSNAVKYSSTREVSRVRVWAKEDDREWTIAVQDNGVGFNPDYAQKLFGIFQRLHTERQFKGTGVGLATVRRILLKHGGRVTAESVEHEGATFSFTLPKTSKIVSQTIV